MGLSNELSCESGSVSCCCFHPMGVFSQRFEALFPPSWSRGLHGLFSSPPPTLPFLWFYLCANVGPWGLPATTLWGLLAAAWPAPLHNPPPHWVCQPLPCHESSLPGCLSPPLLPISAPPSSLDEFFFFISLVVRLLCGLIFCHFWLFFVFKLLSFFWLCEEAQCVYVCLHLGRNSLNFFTFLM